MVVAEHFQRFAGGSHTALFHVFETLTDAFECICLGCDIQEALIGFGILHDSFSFSVHCKNERLFRFFEMLHELRWIAPEGRHGLNVFF